MGVPLTEKARSLLRSQRDRLIRECIADQILDRMVEMMVITPAELMEISAEKTERLRSEAVLDMVMIKGQSAYNALYMSLKEEYEWLTPPLRDGVTQEGYESDEEQGYTRSEVQSILTKGGVPARPRVYVDRLDKKMLIQTCLSKLQDNPGYVVVHGMGGTGKSVIAAEALRSSLILKDYFPGGVIWLPVGRVDKNQLLTKVQNLCLRLDQNQSRTPPRNLEEAKDRLRSIFQEQYPCSLIILDDVWSSKVLQVMDIHARFLITTRDKSITDFVAGPVYEVAIGDDGFSESQSMQFLASWAKMNVQDLPSEASAIAEASKGSPLILSVIGGLLRENPHRWDFYLKKLQEKNYSKLRKRSSYEYKSVDEAIGTSVEELPLTLQKRYKDFAVFNPGVRIPAKVLAVYWSKDVEDVEEELIPLVNKSLIRKEWNEGLDCMVYSIHDLLLDFLQHLSSEEQKEDMHKRLTLAYKDACAGAFHTLEDDTYVYTYLAMHAAKASFTEILTLLLTDWRWIQRKVRIAGPASVLTNLVEYSENIGDSDRDIAKEFQNFIGVNSHLLVERPHPDMVQLALNSRQQSHLHQVALKIATETGDRPYFEWINQLQQPNHLAFAGRLHEGSIRHAKFSPDGGNIISCGEDTTIKVWDVSSGTVLRALDSHEEDVISVDYSPEGEWIVSGDADGKLILWSALSGTSFKQLDSGTIFKRQDSGTIFKRQDSGTSYKQQDSRDRDAITMCKFSHDGEEVAYTTIGGKIGIVKTMPDFVGVTYYVGQVGINALAFSKDDTSVMCSCSDGIVRIFNKSPWSQDLEYNHSKYNKLDFPANIVWCDFQPVGENAASAESSQIHFWNCFTGEHIDRIKIRSAFVQWCDFSHVKGLLAAALSDMTIWTWDCNTLSPLMVYQGPNIFLHVAFDPNDEQLVTSGIEGTVMVWKVVHEPCQISALTRKFAVAFNPNGDVNHICTSDRNNQFLLMDTEESSVVSQEKSRISCFAITENGSWAVYGCQDGSVVKVDMLQEKDTQRITEHKAGVVRCSLSNRSNVVASCAEDGSLVIWEEGKGHKNLVGHSGMINYCHFFQSDSKLFSSSRDCTIKVWNIATGALEASSRAHEDWILSSEVTADIAVTTSVDKTAKLWTLPGLRLIHNLTGHNDIVRSCCLSKDGTIAATGADNGIIIIWNTKSGTKLSQCSRHQSWVMYMHFSSDNKKLVSVGENIRWWGIDGSLLQSFFVRGAYLRQIEVNKYFTVFVSIDSAGVLYILKRL